MAFVESYIETVGDTSRIHGPVECGWRVFEIDGRRILQLDTYGSRDRQLPGKVSQTLQLDRAGAEELVRIMTHAFPGLELPR